MNLDEFEAVEAEADRQFTRARETYEAMPAEDVFKWAFSKGVHFGVTLAMDGLCICPKGGYARAATNEKCPVHGKKKEES